MNLKFEFPLFILLRSVSGISGFICFLFHLTFINQVFAAEKCNHVFSKSESLRIKKIEELLHLYNLYQNENQTKDNLKSVFLYQTLISQLRFLIENDQRELINDFFSRINQKSQFLQKMKEITIYREKSFFPTMFKPAIKIRQMSYALMEDKKQLVYINPENELTILSIPDFKVVSRIKLQIKKSIL